MFALPFCHNFAAPRRPDMASLAAGTALVALAALVFLPLRTAVVPVSSMPGRAAITVQIAGTSLPALRDRAETIRARLLAVPGVGAVSLHGLLTTGLEVDYAPARLARLGITAEDLRAALPTGAQSAPGRFLLRPENVQDGPQPVADRVVHANGHAFRVGDIAAVARTMIGPVSVLSRDGHPAVELEILPAPGTVPGSLDRPIAAALDGMAPPGTVLR